MRRRAAAPILVLAVAACGTTAREAAPLKCVVRVYFCTDVTCNAAGTNADVAAARRRLSARDDVWSVRFVSKAEALREMKRRHPAEVAALPSNPFPDALRVRPVKGADRARIADSVAAGKGGVERVAFAHDPICGGE
jgi:cell division protein FtsX